MDNAPNQYLAWGGESDGYCAQCNGTIPGGAA